MNFRFKALAKQREPDELDAPAALASPRGWLALAALAAVMGAAGVWAVVGRLPQTVSAAGLIARPYGAADVQSLYSGLVTSVHVGAGAAIGPGQTIAVVRDAHGAAHDVVSLFAGQVAAVQVATGQVIAVGAPVAVVERAGPGAGEPLAMLFVSPAQAAGIAPGQNVGLSVASAPQAAFGLLKGQVQAIGRFPLTTAEESALVGGPLAGAVLGGEAGKLLVTVRLRRDGGTPSGYAWTTVSGPPQPLPPVTPATGTITLGAQAPITLLFSR